MKPEGDASSLRILIAGISAGGADSLPEKLLQRIIQTDVLVGGQRHLDYFPNFTGDPLAIGANVDEVIQRLHQALKNNEQATFFGDELCFGFVKYTR